MTYDWEIIKSAKSLSETSQKEKFPYFMNPKDVYNLKIQVNKNVFSPKHAKGYKFFIPLLPDPKGKRILEIGSGHGIVSCYLASKGAELVLATDINPKAVKNTKINAKLNNLSNLQTKESDVFSNIKSNKKFDIIFWNTPWVNVPKSYKKEMVLEDYGMFDIEYKAISKFILEGKNYLSLSGSLYLGFGVEGANTKLINILIKKSGLKKEVIADDYFSPGVKNNGEPVKFRMRLYKLT